MPNKHQYINEKMNPTRLRAWAKNIGEYSTLFVEDTFAEVKHTEEYQRYFHLQNFMEKQS